ncbi:RNA-directed DNA polymerase, eukaryota, partial [Tanacetum coccineum]
EREGGLIMGKLNKNIDSNGWTWIFRNNKTPISKPITNPFHREVDKVATSFYVTNFSDSLDAKGLWNVCTSYGRLVDAFIANKRSKVGKRFGFICFMGVSDASEFVSVPLDVNKTNPNPNSKNIPHNQNDMHSDRSFASVVHGKPMPHEDNANRNKNRVVTLNDQDLISVDDTSKALLVKLKDLES